MFPGSSLIYSVEVTGFQNQKGSFCVCDLTHQMVAVASCRNCPTSYVISLSYPRFNDLHMSCQPDTNARHAFLHNLCTKNADTSATIHCLFLWLFWEVHIFRIIQDQPIAALGYDSGCLQRVVSFRGCWSSTCTCLGLPKSGLVLLHLLHALDNDARICS